MYVLTALVCFDIIVLISCREVPPTFTVPNGTWLQPIEYVRHPESKFINCQAQANPPAKYRWTCNGTTIPWGKNVIAFNEINGTLRTGPGFNGNHLGEFQCIAYNDFGTLMTPLLTIMSAVHESFFGAVEPRRVNVFESKYIKLDCDGVNENVPWPQFYWFRGNTEDPGDFVPFDLGERMIIDHKGSLHFLWTKMEDSFSYTCGTYNSVYLSTKRNPRFIKLEVKEGRKVDREPELKYQHNLEVYAGENAVLMCIFTYFSKNGKQMEVNWKHVGEKVHTGQIYTLTNVQLPSDTVDQEGEYMCEASLGSRKMFGWVNLKIVGPPTFVHAPITKYVPVEKPAVVDCKTTSHNSYSFPPVWFKNGQPLTGCQKYYFECKTRRSDGYSNCVSEKKVCDNVPDCVDGSDEDNCLGSCPESQERCGELCISESADCLELPCSYPNFTCHYKGGCVTPNKICDGIPHCKDGSDELACPNGEVTQVDRISINSARTQLTLQDVRLEDTMCLQCMVRNEYGSIFGDACLTVIDKIRVLRKPNSTYYVEPGSRLEITVEATTDIMWRNQLEFIWQWYEEVTDKKTGTTSLVPVKLPPGGITSNFFHVSRNNMTIMFPEEKKGEEEAVYAVYQELIGRMFTLVIKHDYDRAEFNFTVNGKHMRNPAGLVQAASTNLWFIAIIFGILLLFVIVALIIFYMYRNRGGTYPVDEEEKKAGHDPEQELEDGGLHDVDRIEDEDDGVKPQGDIVSLSESVLPYESSDDDDPTEEYGGEFDNGKFNEDGSFIGVYGDKRADLKEVTV